MWQVVKLFFEIAERYVVTALLVILSPLAFAMGGSKNTADIFKGWCRMFGSMCAMMVLNVIFLKLLISAMADMMALDGGKYGKGILDSCRVKFIMQMEEQEARLVQEKLNLTEEETRMITRFRRGEGLLCIGHNHVPIAIHVSPREYEAITTSPTDLRARLKQEEA